MAKPINLDGLKHLNIDQAVIDTDAAAVLHSATQAVSKILARRQEMDANGLKDKPLVVLAGENHALPAASLHHMVLLHKMRHTGPGTAFTYELPHDFDKSIGALLLTDPSRFNTEDKSRWLVSTYLDFFSCSFARYGKKALFNFCLRQEIPFRTTDTSMRNHRLNTADPSTQASLDACSKTQSWLSRIFASSSGPSATDRRGMFARNHHMVKTSLSFAEETGARILVQHCGNAHVSGFNEKPYKESLLALFKKAGHEALTVYANQDADHDTSDLPKWRARFDQATQELPGWTDFRNDKEEQIYLDALLAKTKMAQYSYTAEAKKEVGKTVAKLLKTASGLTP